VNAVAAEDTPPSDPSPGTGPRTGARRRPARGPRRVTGTGVVVALALVAAAGLRIWILRGPLGHVDGDEAVVGLMALAFRHGHPSAMFWGQNYGGSIESALTGVLFTVAGPSHTALKLVPIALAAGSAFVLSLVARRFIDRRAATFAGVLLLVYPPFSVWWSTKARGIYWAALLLVLAAVLMALRYVDSGRRRDLMGLGVLAGLAWWANPQSVFVLVPLLGWLVVRCRSRWRALWPVIPAALLGALPWLGWNATHGWPSLDLSNHAAHVGYLERLRLFAVRALPQALGFRMPYTDRWLLGPVGPVLYVGAIVAFTVFAVRTIGDPTARRRWAPVLTVVIGFVFVYALPIQTQYTGEPRYVQLLLPFVILILSSALVAWRRQAVALGVAVALAVAVLIPLATTTTREAAFKEAHPPSVTGLTRHLRAEGVRAVRASYWIAYPVSFDSRRGILADSSGAIRDRSAQHRARHLRPAIVVLRGSAADRRLRARAATDGLHRTTYERFAIYRAAPTGLEAGSASASAAAVVAARAAAPTSSP
jgi:hypothetical protein